MSTPDVPYRFEHALEVPGTPEQVWRAIATAEGITSWMMPTELDARDGGAVVFHMGPGEEHRSIGRVTAFEPARRFAYEEDWAALVGQPGTAVTPLVTEFVVEARAGGTCVVRVVTSAFGTGAAWEDEFWEEMGSGWVPMLDNLRLYLQSFPDQAATPLWVGSTFTSTPEDAITAVRRRLGVDEVGDEVLDDGLRATGVVARVERIVARHVLLRLDAPVPGFLSFYSFANETGSGVHLQGYLFSDGAPAYVASAQPGWQRWLDGVAAPSGVASRP